MLRILSILFCLSLYSTYSSGLTQTPISPQAFHTLMSDHGYTQNAEHSNGTIVYEKGEVSFKFRRIKKRERLTQILKILGYKLEKVALANFGIEAQRANRQTMEPRITVKINRSKENSEWAWLPALRLYQRASGNYHEAGLEPVDTTNWSFAETPIARPTKEAIGGLLNFIDQYSREK